MGLWPPVVEVEGLTLTDFKLDPGIGATAYSMDTSLDRPWLVKWNRPNHAIDLKRFAVFDLIYDQICSTVRGGNGFASKFMPTTGQAQKHNANEHGRI
jgi:hypothetical protein